MRLVNGPVGEGLESEISLSLSRDDDGAAAAAIAAAAAAAAADGLVLRGSRGASQDPDAGSDSDVTDGCSPRSSVAESQLREDVRQQQNRYNQQVSGPAIDGLSRPAEDSSTNGLPFRQAVNAACTSASLQRLAETFRFVAPSPCICDDSTSCSFGGEAGLVYQQQRRQMLRVLTQEDSSMAEAPQQVELEPFSLFAPHAEAGAPLCCERHARLKAAEGNGSSSSSGGSAVLAAAGDVVEGECNWSSFATSLNQELDSIIDTVSAFFRLLFFVRAYLPLCLLLYVCLIVHSVAIVPGCIFLCFMAACCIGLLQHFCA